ncbi:MAG: MBL fold metallo-hydrolase [Halodesulfurarchaeum sp.]
MDVSLLTGDADVFTANAYLVTDGSPTLVDVGTVSGIASRISNHVDDLETVVLTHQHTDHVARLDEVMEAFDPTLVAAADTAYRTTIVEDGDEVQIGEEAFEVVATPGHANDHLAFVGETAVFSGDVVVYNDTAFEDGSFGRTDQPGQDRETLIESIERLQVRLSPSVESLFAGHGDPYHGDVSAVVRRALERARRREPKYPEE